MLWTISQVKVELTSDQHTSALLFLSGSSVQRWISKACSHWPFHEGVLWHESWEKSMLTDTPPCPRNGALAWPAARPWTEPVSVFVWWPSVSTIQFPLSKAPLWQPWRHYTAPRWMSDLWTVGSGRFTWCTRWRDAQWPMPVTSLGVW